MYGSYSVNYISFEKQPKTVNLSTKWNSSYVYLGLKN